MRKTKREILEDVEALVLKQGGRSVDERGFCQYIFGHRVCGHSMAVKEELREDFNEMAAHEVIKHLGGDTCHKKEYQGHEKGFWTKVQIFHDDEYHWNEENKITEEGKDFKENILTKFK